MKRCRIPLALLGVALAILLPACRESSSSTQAGKATTASLLKLLPENTRGVVAVDVRRIFQTDAAKKALQDPKTTEEMKKAVDKTGIDPRTDLYLVVMGITKQPGLTGQMPGALIFNLKYDKATLLAKLKAESKRPVQEETYKGTTIYYDFGDEGSKASGAGAFLDASNIVLGEMDTVKAVIDRSKGEGKDVTSNPDLKNVLDTTDKSGLLWGAFAIPPELAKKAAESNPMAKTFEGLNAVSLMFDYKNNALLAEIKALGGSEEQNKKIAEMLTGFKAMGSTMAAKEPAAVKAIDSIAVTSGADFVKLRADLPEELLQKLGSAARDKVSGMVQPKSEPAPEEKKESEGN